MMRPPRSRRSTSVIGAPGGDEQVVPGAVMGERHRHTHGVSLGESCEQLPSGLEPGLADAVGDTTQK